MRGLAGKLALVTGGSGLIGGAVSVRLAEEGARVIVGSRSVEKARAWCDQQYVPDGSLIPMTLDLSTPDGVGAAMDHLRDVTGLPTIFVACAIPLEALPIPVDELSHEHFSALTEVDIAGHFMLVRDLAYALPPDETASIVWLSSIYGSAGVDHGIYPEGMMHSPPHYAACKAAVQGTVRWMATTWGPRGIRANAVVSGGVRSSARQNEEFVRRYNEKTMLRRMAEPSEIASACVFLASDDASYITGSCVNVEGGFLAW
jgi:NAD(P)-dependent dehydrogenase (short-subunit alcohol dehydrogenase family)